MQCFDGRISNKHPFHFLDSSLSDGIGGGNWGNNSWLSSRDPLGDPRGGLLVSGSGFPALESLVSESVFLDQLSIQMVDQQLYIKINKSTHNDYIVNTSFILTNLFQ